MFFWKARGETTEHQQVNWNVCAQADGAVGRDRDRTCDPYHVKRQANLFAQRAAIQLSERKCAARRALEAVEDRLECALGSTPAHCGELS